MSRVPARATIARVGVVEVQTERLLLRGWHAEDHDALAAINADPEVMRWIGSGRVLGRGLSDELIARAEREWDERGFGLWAVATRAEPQVALGFCGLATPMFLPSVLPAVEVGWRLRGDAWGRGYATEAARAALRFAFDDHGMREVIAVVDPRNERSLRVARKLGMSERPARVHPATGRRLTVLGLTPEELH